MNSDSMFARCDADELHTKKQKFEVNRFSELQRRNLGMFTLLWYCDTDIILNEQHQQTQMKLREFINFIVSFNNAIECEKYIQQIKDEKVILIVSNKTARELLLNIHDLEQVANIYVYNYYINKEEDNDKLWINNYQKVKAVVTTSSDLIKKISEDQIKRIKNERTISTTILPTMWSESGKTHEEDRTHNKLDGNFLWSRLFIQALIKLKDEYMTTSIDEFTNLCYEQYAGNDTQCTRISTFKETYKPSDAIKWYAKEPFVYELLNKALRIQDIDTVFTFRFLIHDICEQLDIEQVNYFLKLEEKHAELSMEKMIYSWRGQNMSIEEFEKLRLREGQYITINSFFSTSKNKQIGLIFAQSNNNKVPVLFEIESDICSLVSRPFADVTHLSPFHDEEEILFMAGVIFKIIDVHYDDKVDHVWIIKLLLCDERNTQLNKILIELINEILPTRTNFMSIGNVLMQMGLYDKAEEYYQRHLKTLRSDDKPNLIQAYMNLTVIAEAKEDRQLATTHWKTAIDLIGNTFSNIDNSIQDIFYSFNNYLARNYQQSDYDKMFQFIQQIHSDDLETAGHDNLKTAGCYALYSYFLRAQGKLNESLENCEKSLKIRLKLLPENHPTLGNSYERIGDLHALKKDYSSALISYQKALTIKSTSLPDYHPDITKLRNNITSICKQHIQN